MSPAAAARRENLDLFVKAVADFQAVDGDVTLPALLAWLDAEDEFGQGLEVATPSEADSVKLLTVHRAKGLEWHTVFLRRGRRGQVPDHPGPIVMAVDARRCCPRRSGATRATCPRSHGHDNDDSTT